MRYSLELFDDLFRKYTFVSADFKHHTFRLMFDVYKNGLEYDMAMKTFKLYTGSRPFTNSTGPRIHRS